jgi:predicted ester cyclase
MAVAFLALPLRRHSQEETQLPEVKDTSDRFVAAFNAHDQHALDNLHAHDIKFNAPGGFKATNAKDATAYAMTWLKAFPDGKLKVRSEIISGPWVVQEVVMEGTHTAPLESPTGTIPATYKKVVSYGVQLLRVENAKISEARIYFDQLDFMTQLGLIPTPATV